jgi:hypothetical protein
MVGDVKFDFPVSSVNGQTGHVKFDFPVSSVNSTTLYLLSTLLQSYNDSHYITTDALPVSSVNGMFGNVILKTSDL